MIYLDNTKEMIKEYLVNETNNEYVIRCPYCGDSKKNLQKGHLNISKTIPVFRCVRCEESGSIQKLLFDLNGVKYRLKTLVKPDRLNHLKEIKFTNTKILDKKSFIIPELDLNTFKYKHRYLYSRILNKKILDSIKDNMIYDLRLFVELNNISIPEEKNNLFTFLHNNFIGFLSYNHSTVIFRNIDSSSDFRYYIWKLDDFLNDFFLLEKLTEEKKEVNLVVGEGIFDIINAYTYEKNVDLFVNASGKLFERAIKFVMINKCITYFNKIIILGDDDVPLLYFKKLAKKIKNISKSIELWFNTDGHDFGVKTQINKTVINL